MFQESFNESFNQITRDFEEFLKDIRGINILILESSPKENFFDILIDKIQSYRIKFKKLFINEIPFALTSDLINLMDLFLDELIIMEGQLGSYRTAFEYPKKNIINIKETFAKEMNFRIKNFSEYCLLISKGIQDVQDDFRFGKVSKNILYNKNPKQLEKKLFDSSFGPRPIRRLYQEERNRRTQLNNNFFNYFKTPELKISFYGDAFDNKFLVNRIYHHKENIDSVKTAFDGILND